AIRIRLRNDRRSAATVASGLNRHLASAVFTTDIIGQKLQEGFMKFWRPTAVCQPMPLFAPVTTASLPCSDGMSAIVHFVMLFFLSATMLSSFSTSMNAYALIIDAKKCLPARNPRPEHFKPGGPVHLRPFRLPQRVSDAPL